MSQLPAAEGRHPSRWEPKNPARRENPLEMLFGRLWNGWAAPFDRAFASMRIWDFDITERDTVIVVRAELPGFEEDEIQVEVANGVVTIDARREKSTEGREEQRSYFRSFQVPRGSSVDDIQATYRNGVLELRLPKSPEARPRRIPVRQAQDPRTSGTAVETPPAPAEGSIPESGI